MATARLVLSIALSLSHIAVFPCPNPNRRPDDNSLNDESVIFTGIDGAPTHRLNTGCGHAMLSRPLRGSGESTGSADQVLYLCKFVLHLLG